jgi:sphingolipid 4-desaturase/C4-monooxygenase
MKGINDFHYTNDSEPHKKRRNEMIKKYPQIKELFGYDPNTKYQVLAWIVAQAIFAFLLKDKPWWMVLSWGFILFNFSLYFWWLCWYSSFKYSGTALYLAMHEISHNLLFEDVTYNKLFGVFTNTITVFPHFSYIPFNS